MNGVFFAFKHHCLKNYIFRWLSVWSLESLIFFFVLIFQYQWNVCNQLWFPIYKQFLIINQGTFRIFPVRSFEIY